MLTALLKHQKFPSPQHVVFPIRKIVLSAQYEPEHFTGDRRVWEVCLEACGGVLHLVAHIEP
jgi:hypothetical protein